MKTFLLFFVVFKTSILLGQTSTKNIVTDKLPGVNCNNVVQNILPADAPNRSPSACEIQFDREVRTALKKALENAFPNFPEKDWQISDTAIEVLSGVGKQTEENFFALSYYFKMDLDPGSPAYAGWNEKYQTQLDALRTPGESTYKNFVDFSYRMRNAIRVRFYISVNAVSQRIYFMKGGQQNISIPGATYAVKGPYVANLNGGGVEESLNAGLILFGKFRMLQQKEENNGASVATEASFPKGTSKLTVQNIAIRIECNDELMSKVLKDTDWKALAGMIGH